MDYTKLSKEVSYALRHAPWEYELDMDEEGFVSVSPLLLSLNETDHYDREMTEDDLYKMMEKSDKKRHEIVNGKIRALYGHSFPMHIRKDKTVPQDILYHGTAHQALPSILKDGLKPMRRQYVHLSKDIDTAVQVGKRRDSSPVILVIDSKKASKDGIPFYYGNDKVVLADQIPACYITVYRQ